MDPAQALKCTALFRELDSPDLAALAARAVERRLKRGEILFVAGDPAGGLYVVVEGAIRAYRVSADGREQILHVEHAGATLGEVPVFDEGCYPSTAAAEEDSTLLFIKKRDVLNLCLERPRISLAALKLLARRLRNCAALVESLSLRDVDRRLAALLCAEVPIPAGAAARRRRSNWLLLTNRSPLESDLSGKSFPERFPASSTAVLSKWMAVTSLSWTKKDYGTTGPSK